jgi:hypothetical protein
VNARSPLRFAPITFLAVAAAALGACGAPTAHAPQATPSVFDRVVPSVVAVMNDDRDLRDEEAKHALAEMGLEGHAPKSVVDVSLRKEPSPHGTGFMIEGGLILTAAHVVHTPDRLKVTTRAKRTVDVEVVKIDEVRDVAVLRPKAPMPEVPPLPLDRGTAKVGNKVWAMGHTGGGLWELAWGVTEGVTSGVVDMLGAQLVLHDAAVYPGFSGGPVVTVDDAGTPRVLGVNHAILFTGGLLPVATISSASSVGDIRAVLAGQPPAVQGKLATFAKSRGAETRAELFVSESLAVHRDPQLLTTAAIRENRRFIEAQEEARVPIVAMLFGVEPGAHEVQLKVSDPDDHTVADVKRTVNVPPHERIGFVSADLRFWAKESGRYEIHAYEKGKVIGHTDVWVIDSDGGAPPLNDADVDDVEGGDPRVSVVVAQAGMTDPLTLVGIRAGWSEWRYPRRVAFTWFARGSRGWTGTNVAISSFVLDDKGTIVGRGVGCIRPELRPELPWSCMGQGGTPLLGGAGRYDIVFAINDRPVAVWPMEAIVRVDGKNSALERWLDEVKKSGGVKKHDHGPPKGMAPPPASGAPPAPSAPPPAPSTPPRVTPPPPPAPLPPTGGGGGKPKGGKPGKKR